MGKEKEIKEEENNFNKKKAEEYSSNKKGNTALIIGLIACVFSFLGIIILPLSIVGLVKGIKCEGDSGTKVAAIIFNSLSILIEIIATIVIVIFFGFLAFTFTTFDKSIDRAKEFVEEHDYDFDGGYKHDYYGDWGYDTTTIGNEKFGYLEIPSRWEYTKELGDETIIYSSVVDDSEIMLGVADDGATMDDVYSKIMLSLSKEGNSVESNTIKMLSRYEGYEIIASSKDDIVTKIYLFETEDSVIRTIGITCSDKDSDLFNIYKTYRIDNIKVVG